MKKIIFGTTFVLLTVFFASKIFPHCQIPCGIYDDQMRISMIKEHITTIEKSMKEIIALSKQDEKNYNQIVRWVVNKEAHADELSEIVTFYFMTQRLKPIDEKDSKTYKEYLKKLTLLHEMLVFAMKAKQTTDLINVEKLRSLADDFSKVYFEQGHSH